MFKRLKDQFLKDKPTYIKPILDSKDAEGYIPEYLEKLKYGEIRERYRKYIKPIICVMDNGVNPLHEDIKHSIVERVDFTGEGWVTEQAHGQHVTSIAAGYNYSLSDNIPTVHYKVLTSGGGGSMGMLVDGLKMAFEKKYKIINLSLGSDFEDARVEYWIRKITQQGAFVIIAAGNGGQGDRTDFPALLSKRVPGVISVSSSDGNRFSDFNSTGKNTITAQGENVLSAGIYWKGVSKYRIMNGTSMAAPLVSSVLAISMAINPSFELKNFHQIAKETSLPLENNYDYGYEYELLVPELFLEKVEKIEKT